MADEVIITILKFGPLQENNNLLNLKYLERKPKDENYKQKIDV